MLYEFTELLVLFDIESSYFKNLSELVKTNKTLQFLNRYSISITTKLKDIKNLQTLDLFNNQIVDVSFTD
jgi:Leucine-rich repeat (LRR) protein